MGHFARILSSTLIVGCFKSCLCDQHGLKHYST